MGEQMRRSAPPRDTLLQLLAHGEHNIRIANHLFFHAIDRDVVQAGPFAEIVNAVIDPTINR